MIVTLKDTTAGKIVSALIEAHRGIGGSSALVHTLITICDQSHYESVLADAVEAAREHPARVLMVVNTKGRTSKLDAEIQAGETTPGDVIVLRMSGEIAAHPDSVVLPLLLPDSPVIAWWPHNAPDDMADDSIGRFATRRISDSASAPDPCAALRRRAEHLSAGDSDLCWARITRWRALAAAALDQHPGLVHSARVEADPRNGPTSLLTAWLAERLGVPVERCDADGPGGIVALSLTTAAGDIEIRRTDGRSAVYRIPGEPARGVALERRSVADVMSEELRRLDPDPVQGEVMEALAHGLGQTRPAVDASAADEDGAGTDPLDGAGTDSPDGAGQDTAMSGTRTEEPAR